MTSHTGVHVLDVGHGSCLAIVEDHQAVLIDTGRGNTVQLFLREAGVTHLPLVLLSHADADHIGGLMGLLSSKDLTVGSVWLNSDAQKGSKLWKDLTWKLSLSHEKGALDFHTDLKRGQTFSTLLGLTLACISSSRIYGRDWGRRNTADRATNLNQQYERRHQDRSRRRTACPVHGRPR